MTNPAKTAARDASRSRVFHALARSGYAVNGLLHASVGGIAIGVAVTGRSNGQADQSGALRQVADTPGGLFVLWAAVVALFALGLWQLVRSVLATDGGTVKKWGKRASEAIKSVVYFVIGGTALVFALGGRTNSSESSHTLTAWLLETPGGIVLLLAIGGTVFGTGIGFVSIGIRRTFRKLIHVPAGAAGRAVVVLGIVGYIAEGVAFGLVGTLFVVAAVLVDPEQPSGLDGALTSLTQLPYGFAMLLVIGLGLIAYGLFLAARTRLARL